MTEQDIHWNKFIENVCGRDISTLSPAQKRAVLCFRYDSEMENGGHSAYLENHPETNPDELEDAILTVGCKEMADNYRKAITDGEEDDWEETDNAYYDFEPSLCDCLQEFVEKNKDIIFD
ncbi:hypothetical protein E5358_06665 [Palleniella muris]|uniref:Uncharacterized protein n=1 Tax=Palleniella muris TaxID=3038145 RepID=A0AC61QQH2_9BACT|nr:hypothetical protein [Palleniella muris]TGX82448.1 hypothetical protein E5358_06665 [Palleniella muris]